MATLTSLKLVAVKRTATQNPIVHRRQKLCTKIAEQINLAKALKNGETYAPTRLKTVPNSLARNVTTDSIASVFLRTVSNTLRTLREPIGFLTPLPAICLSLEQMIGLYW